MEPYTFFRIVFFLFGSLLLALFSLYEKAHAYIPKTRFVLEKVAKNHGRGYYTIQNEVIFRAETTSTSVIETWVIENGENMYLETRGATGIPSFVIYKGRQKLFIDEQGQERAARITPDFFEDIFHFRTFESIAEELVRDGILPQKALAKEPKIRNLKEAVGNKEPFIRLSRTGGSITYGIGKPTPTDSAPLPGVWVEQDRFHIKRLRLPSLAEVFADDYADYGRGLSFPKARLVNWGANSVSIRTIKVSAITPTAEQKAKLQPSYLRSRKTNVVTSPQNDNPAMKEFYARFR